MSFSLVLATRNPGKVTEIRALLDDLPVSLIPADDIDGAPEVEEDRPTLRGNACKKAETLHAHTGHPALADDTGLEVDALDGAPGVHTARFAGPDATFASNNAKLLDALKDASDRSAQFRTVVALVDGEAVQTFEGTCRGRIAETPRGAQGFGYDPLFIPEGADQTFAEMDADQKNVISHRKKALEQLSDYLHNRLEADQGK